VLSSITSLVVMYWFLVKDLLHDSSDPDAQKDLYTIFHPYGYLLMLIAFIGLAGSNLLFLFPLLLLLLFLFS